MITEKIGWLGLRGWGDMQEQEKEGMEGESPVASDPQVTSDSLVRAYLRRGGGNVDSRRGASPRALHRASPTGQPTPSPAPWLSPSLVVLVRLTLRASACVPHS